MDNVNYVPFTAVWEVTMGCNMRCGHCGSSCEDSHPDELNTEEALRLCDEIAGLGLRWITLSGGEPLTRKDTPMLVKRLSKQGIAVNMITNGWLLTPEMAKILKESGIATVAISVDGTQELHDSIRKSGAYEHVVRAFGEMRRQGIQAGAVTTVTKRNLGNLEDLKEALIHMGVQSWQIQLGLPMGNLRKRPDWVLEPEQVRDVIDFCHTVAVEGRIRIFPADCIGYYSKKEHEVLCIAYGTSVVPAWDGCNAGVRGFGILHNGDIVGCTSMRSAEFVEGSIRKRPLRAIWEDEHSFQWRRQMVQEQLSGFCKACIYGSKCLGGCSNTRLTMEGSIYGENQYCDYNLIMKERQKECS